MRFEPMWRTLFGLRIKPHNRIGDSIALVLAPSVPFWLMGETQMGVHPNAEPQRTVPDELSP